MSDESQLFFYKNNRLQQLRGFCYAAQHANITHAAKHMGLTASSVSLQIKALEEDMGVVLFERKGPRIALTPEGRRLLKIALPLVEGIQNIPLAFQESSPNPQHTDVAIAVNSTSLNFILPTISKTYLATHPDVSLTLHYAEHHEALEKIMSDEVEFAVLPRRDHLPFPKETLYMPLFFYTPCLITRPDHPLANRTNLSIEEISQHDLTLPAEDLRVIPDLYDIFPRHQINKKLRINFVNWETTRKYIEAGLVISISSDVIIGENDTLVGTPLNHLFRSVDYGIVCKQGKHMSKPVMQFIEIAHSMRKNL